MKTYRYEIAAENIGDYRRTTISEKVVEIDPDGFTCDEVTGGRILREHGWTAEKSESSK